MPTTKNYLALDLGAESGRAMLGRLDGERLRLEEVHRFPNIPARTADGLHWDVLRLWNEIKTGIGKATHAAGGDLAGIGLDTWGVDFALLDQAGALVGNPHHYRDSRTAGMMAEAFARLPREQIFDQTGIQFMEINALYQLLSMVVSDSPSLKAATTFLTIPDLFNYWLTGEKVCEFSNATTTQCYDPRRRTWARPLLEALGIPQHIFPDIVPPGTILGSLAGFVAEEAGAGDTPVVSPACHDTGSAVAAIPAGDEHFVWISSGTWSVMGVNSPQPVITSQSLAYNFTNEGGIGGSYRFSKNIMGLWVVQECRRTWANQGQELSYSQLTAMAGEAQPFVAIIDVDDSDFLRPGDMPARIREYCTRTHQTAPASMGEVVRCALEGIALKYRLVLDRIEEMTGLHYPALHIVGGGTQNRLLSQMTADVTGRRVITGPIEATATGNVLVQALALGHIGSLAEVRAVVRNSFEVSTFAPGSQADWDEAYARLKQLAG